MGPGTNGVPGRAAASENDRFPIVAVGASAGGVEALGRLFANCPPDVGVAFVVLQHLDPDHESLLPELLGRASRMPLVKAEDATTIEVGHVYVVPENVAPVVEAGVLRFERPSTPHGHRDSIDLLMRSLAEDQGSLAIGIILSGTGGDGTAGLAAIKENGGFTIVQDPSEAKFDGMPRSAIVAGQVDEVLPVDRMAAALAAYAKRIGGGPPEGALEAGEAPEAAFQTILARLRERTGRDFTHYKRTTLFRRLKRRMEIRRVEDFAAYVSILDTEPDEADLLCKDMLISVTQFFRDKEAFDSLEALVIPALVDRRQSQTPPGLRVWVVGCATGEEAYSIGMLLRERVAGISRACPIQIFATDVDERALETARRGIYPRSIAEHVGQARLDRHFHATDDGYRVNKDLREMCVFSLHDILRDPPFSRLDLITCRNVFIYLEADAQLRILPIFHYALRTGGALFLGPSENVASHSDLYRPLDKKNRIFERLDVTATQGFVFPISSRGTGSRWFDRDHAWVSPLSARQQIGESFRRVLIEDYAPGAAVVTAKGEILHVAGRTSAFLELAQGVFENNILAMAHPALRLELRAALSNAARSRQLVEVNGIALHRGADISDVRLVVRPMAAPAMPEPLFMVIFQELSRAAPVGIHVAPEDESDAVPIEHVRELESELRRTREDLQATIAEVEAANDELKSSNEELMSINEEFQSSNEELQTSKEELQSVNEELQTVNAELGKRIEEINRANDDLQNLLRSTQLATLFLDNELCIKRYTPATVNLFRLIDSDIGRPITDISSPFDDPSWLDDVREVLRTLVPKERPIRIGERAWFMMLVLPYRTLSNQIDGVVVTFVNVTELKRAQLHALDLAAIVESSQDAIIGQTLEGTITSWNRGAELLFGFSAYEMLGKSSASLVPEDRKLELETMRAEVEAGDVPKPIETVRLRKDGSGVDVSLAFSPRRDADGRRIGFATIARDVSARKHVEAEKNRLRAELERHLQDTKTILDVVPVGIAIAHDAAASVVTGNAACTRLLGIAPDANISFAPAAPGVDSRPFHMRRDGSEIAPDDIAICRAAARGEVVKAEANELVCRDGSVKHLMVSAVPLLDANGESRGAVAVFADITQQRRATMDLEQTARHTDEFLAMLGHELRNPLAAMTGAWMLLERTLDEKDKAPALGVLGRQLRHLARLVDDLLDLSRLSRGKIELRREPIDFADITRSVVEDYHAAYAARGVTLRFGDGDTPAWVMGDGVRLSQVVSNLLSNSLKFTERGGSVTVSLSQQAGFIELRVVDTGVGLEPAVLESIFEPFVQAVGESHRTAGGLGLGLAVCKRLVAMHGGTIVARSEGLGRGATFLVGLPAVSYSALAAKGASEACIEGSRRILLIEDSEDIAAVLRAFLEQSGHVVETAVDGKSGVEAVHSFAPDIVLCDIGLPGDMDGYDIARAVRADPALCNVYLVALTGYARHEDRQRARQAGFDLHVPKPLTADGLDRILSAAPPLRPPASA